MQAAGADVLVVTVNVQRWATMGGYWDVAWYGEGTVPKKNKLGHFDMEQLIPRLAVAVHSAPEQADDA